MEENNSNTLLKTIIFVIVLALTCLLFFGLGNSNKTSIQLIQFGFLVFAELVVYLSTIVPSMLNSKKLTSADIISAGILYAIGAFIINVKLSFINDIKTLVVYNVAAILAYLLLIAIVVAMKKNK